MAAQRPVLDPPLQVVPPRIRMRVFGVLWGAAGLLGLVQIWLGVVDQHVPINIGLGVGAVLWGVLMYSGLFDRSGAWFEHATMAGAVWVITLAFTLTAASHNDVRLYYAWAVAYVALFLGRREVLAHLLHIEVCLAGALWLQPGGFAGRFVVWLDTSALFLVVAVLVVWVAARAEAGLQQLQEQADQDTLTGLPNRRLLMRLLNRSLAEPLTATAVVLLDLDSFKMVNDTHGHDAGDVLLQNVAKRLSSVLQPGEVLARLGGDEFAVVIVERHGRLRLDRRLAQLGDQLGRLWTHALPIAGGLWTSACCGIGIAASSNVTPGDLLRRADVALYEAKAAGRGAIRHYDQSLRDRVERRLQVETALREARRRGDLRVVYQPIVELNTGRLIGAEALCRWFSPALGEITPDEFIPLAEDSGLITELSRFVIAQTLADVGRWRQAGLLPEDFVATLNVSPVLVRPGLADMVAEMVAGAGLPTSTIALELTESVLLADDPDVDTEVLKLRAAGHRLLLDDFGTGYSALSYLTRLPVDVLKLDRSFIPSGVGAGEQDGWAVVTAVLRMAQALGMQVVAEGVEHPEQAERLRRLGCDRGQGWLFGRPADADGFTSLLTMVRRAGTQPSVIA
ncbi:putative bifunctional diguanylate cyclase/phosphodiesterase [Spongisporangium articulatum]|uniref:Bifunctional diguanylate cyclase/phosphodiesterase n=1 Tax=Spongisporangium articulatum TaxID=3362603 RepID=A0ABW8ATT7_9ACTN